MLRLFRVECCRGHQSSINNVIIIIIILNTINNIKAYVRDGVLVRVEVSSVGSGMAHIYWSMYVCVVGRHFINHCVSKYSRRGGGGELVCFCP